MTAPRYIARYDSALVGLLILEVSYSQATVWLSIVVQKEKTVELSLIFYLKPIYSKINLFINFLTTKKAIAPIISEIT